MITREEILWLYRCVLGREPESENAILGHLYVHVDLASARQAIMRSAEFENFYRKVVADQIVFRKRAEMPFVRSNKRLALAAIVRNEEENIVEMITSCASLVQFVAIVDTMSEDNTVSVAKRLLFQLQIEHEIVQSEFLNFSDARNKALDLVPRNIDWTLMLDADERLCENDLDLFAPMLDDDNYDVWSLPRYNFIDNEKLLPPLHYPDRQARLIRNLSTNKLRYSGLVHESIRNARSMGHAPESLPGPHGSIGGPHIHHVGIIGQSAQRSQTKSDLYFRLMVAGGASEAETA